MHIFPEQRKELMCIFPSLREKKEWCTSPKGKETELMHISKLKNFVYSFSKLKKKGTGKSEEKKRSDAMTKGDELTHFSREKKRTNA